MYYHHIQLTLIKNIDSSLVIIFQMVQNFENWSVCDKAQILFILENNDLHII